MILLPKNKIKKLQSGGNIDMYQTAAGSQYHPQQLVMPGFAPYYKPLASQQQNGRRGYGGRGAKNAAKNKEDRTKAKGFSNDIEYAFNERDEIKNRMASQAQDKDYLNSPDYINDYKALQKANVAISQLEAIQKDFNTSLKGKNIEGGSYAIHGDKALVYDGQTNKYDIVELQQAMSTKKKDGSKRYNIETISTAQNLRSRDEQFHGFTENGKFLQELILNSYNSEDLYDTLDDAFESAGVTSDIGTSLALSDGTKIDADDFYRYVASGMDMKAQIMSESTGNETQLRAGVNNMMSRVTSNPGTMSAYKNYAIGRMLDQGVDPTNMSKSQFNGLVQQYVQDDVLSRMKIFIEDKFSNKFKESTKKGKSGGSGGTDASKITMHTNATTASQMQATHKFVGEFESLFNNSRD